MKSLKIISKNYNTTKKEVDFIKIYENYLKEFRFKKNKILEIGFTKDSLGMFREYFPNSFIVGLDIIDKKVNLSNVQTYVGSQTDIQILSKIIKTYKNFDIIIDDGSHMNYDVKFTFNHLFDYLKYNGLYFIEDLQTSYIPSWGGDSLRMNNKNTIMNFIRSLADSIHYQEIDNPFYVRKKFDGQIGYVHIYKNIAVIKKEKNFYESNICFKNSVYLGMIKKRKNFDFSSFRDLKRYAKYFIKNFLNKLRLFG
jgi:hypothetical protein